MPVIVPLWSARNFMPSSTELVSPPSATAGAVKSKIVACGVTAFEAVDCGLVPTALVAVTRNVYAVPLVSPLTVVLVADGADLHRASARCEPTYGVTV